jgi:hypothetical protein
MIEFVGPALLRVVSLKLNTPLAVLHPQDLVLHQPHGQLDQLRKIVHTLVEMIDATKHADIIGLYK